MIRILFLMSLSLNLSTIFACDDEGKTGIFPDNDVKIPVQSKNDPWGMKSFELKSKSLQINSSLDFSLTIQKFERAYTHDLKKAGYTLYVNKQWDNPMVNARTAPFGNYIYIEVFGGLARHPDMTMDGLILALCHELGHHIGGAPKNINSPSKWATNEGQSDYFASMKCFKKIHESEDNIQFLQDIEVPTEIVENCNQVYKNQNESAICQRSSVAAKAITTVLAKIVYAKPPELMAQDLSMVQKTFHGHPQAQCRFDTYLAGSLCDQPIQKELSKTDQHFGTCNRHEGYEIGVRPLCWFKPGHQTSNQRLSPVFVHN